MGVKVFLAENEPISSALRRFKKHVERNTVRWEAHRRICFIKATAKRRAAEFKRRFKARKATLIAKLEGRQPSEPRTDLVADFWRRTGKK